MLRVVYEVITLVNDKPVTCRQERRLAPQDVDVINSTVKGQHVTIVQVERYEPPVRKARVAPTTSDCGWVKIHEQLQKRLRASRYYYYFEEPLRKFARDLEWDAAVRRAGFSGRPFAEIWEIFRKNAYASFWWSRNTRGMITRMAKEAWLLELIETKDEHKRAECP